MALDDNHKQAVARWAGEGLQLSEIQKRLREEFGLSMTFMDVRLLIDDLGVRIKDPKTPARRRDETADFGAAADFGAEDLPPAAGGITVRVDRVIKPGAIVSGTVTFSDGVTCDWMLDQLGRLAVTSGNRPGYKPPRADVPKFQEELRRTLERKGF